MDPSKFDGTAPHTILHRLLAVEQCGVAQLIEDDFKLCRMPCLPYIKKSEWAYYALIEYAKRFRHGRSLKQRFAP